VLQVFRAHPEKCECSLPSTTKTKSADLPQQERAAPAEWRSCRWRRVRTHGLDTTTRPKTTGPLVPADLDARTKLVFSGLTGELETIPDCGSSMALRPSSASLVPADSKENREELGRCPPNPTVRRLVQGPWLASPAENRGKLPGQSERYWLESHAFSWCEMARRVAQCVGSPMNERLGNPLAAATPLRLAGFRGGGFRAAGRWVTRNRGRRRQALWRRATSRPKGVEIAFCGEIGLACD